MSNPALSREVQEAMARRNMGMSTPALQQMSPQNPMKQVPDPATPSSLGEAPQPVTPSAPSQEYTPQNQQDLIVSALIEQLKSSEKLKKEKLKMAQPRQPEQPRVPAPSPPPGGGVSGGGRDRLGSMQTPYSQPTSSKQPLSL